MGKNKMKIFDSLGNPTPTPAEEINVPKERLISKEKLDEMFRARVGNGRVPMTLMNPSPTVTAEIHVAREPIISKVKLDEMFRARVGNDSVVPIALTTNEDQHLALSEEQTPVERLQLTPRQNTASISPSFDDIEFPKTEEVLKDRDVYFSEEMLQSMGKKKKREIEKLLRKREKDIMKLKKLQHKRALLYLKIEDKEHKAQEKQMWTDYHREVMADVKSAKKEKKIKEKEAKEAGKERRETRLYITIRCPKGIFSCFGCFGHHG